MIGGEEPDFSEPLIRHLETSSACQKFDSGCPELKKARYSWQVKSKNWASVNNTDSSSKIVGNRETLTESLKSESNPCCLYGVNKRPTISAKPSDRMCFKTFDHKENGCDSHFLQLNGQHKVINAVIGSALNDSDSDNQEQITMNNPSDMESSKQHDSNMVIVFPLLPVKQNRCSSELSMYSPIQSLASSIDSPEPLHYVAIPTEKSSIEYSLMRAELDNNINKALECLRNQADQRGEREQQTYLSRRNSLETAGIFQVIEQNGLRACSSDVSSCKPPILTSHQKGSDSHFESFLSFHKFPKDGNNITFVDGCEHKNSVEKSPLAHAVSKSDLTVTDNDCSDTLLCQQNSLGKYSNDLTIVNTLLTRTSSFVIDQAVNAVISARGIHL